jgi:PAS domain S-box-containing protein
MTIGTAGYKVSLNALGVAVLVLKPNHTIEYLNEQCCQLLESENEKIRGKNWFQTFVADYQRLRAASALENSLKAEREADVESQEIIVLPSGRELTISWQNSIIKSESGQNEAIIRLGQDITEDIKYRSREKIINERIGDVVVLYSAEGLISYVSQSVTHILGYAPEDLKGKNIISFTHPHDAAGVMEMHHSLLLKPTQTVRSEHRVKNKHGEWIWVEGEARNLLNEPELGAILSNFRDITSRVAAKAALIKSEEKYRTLVNSMAEAVVQINLRGDILFVNNAYCELTGYSEDELIGQNCLSMLIDESELPRVQEELAGNTSGRTDHYEIQLRRKSGHKVWVSANAAPLFDTQGDLIGMLSTLTDITQRKNAAQQLEAMNKEMTDFFYKSSHDLKGPLASVAGLLELAKEDIKDPVATRYCQMMGQAINKLSTTVQQVLQTIKVRDTQAELGYIDFSAIIKDVVLRLGHIPGINDVYIETDVKTTRPFYSDINTSTSIIQNLIENAVKYRSIQRAQSTLHITIEDHGEGVKIIAEDNGIGMSSQVQKKIFDMFFRAHADSQGTGLGLYIVKTAIDKLGGTIEVASEENVGSTFTIFLPGLNAQDMPAKIGSASAVQV